MTLSDKTRNGLAVWAKAILGDPAAPAAKKEIAKEIYASGVDGWNSRLFIFFQNHFLAPTNDTVQSTVNDIVTAVMDDYLASKNL